MKYAQNFFILITLIFMSIVSGCTTNDISGTNRDSDHIFTISGQVEACYPEENYIVINGLPVILQQEEINKIKTGEFLKITLSSSSSEDIYDPKINKVIKIEEYNPTP